MPNLIYYILFMAFLSGFIIYLNLKLGIRMATTLTLYLTILLVLALLTSNKDWLIALTILIVVLTSFLYRLLFGYIRIVPPDPPAKGGGGGYIPLGVINNVCRRAQIIENGREETN